MIYENAGLIEPFFRYSDRFIDSVLYGKILVS